MKQPLIVGIDVSKLTLDIYFKPFEIFFQITNETEGFYKFLSQLSDFMADTKDVLVVMEHTGRYSHRLETFLQEQGIGYCKLSSLQIKRSLGITRGKSDRVDAQRIAEYGWLRRDILQAQDPLQPQLQQLQSLLSLRAKLVRDRAGYVCRLKETKATSSSCCLAFEIKSQQKVIDYLKKSIDEVEEQIKALIKAEPALDKTSKLLQSVKGIGWLIAASMICYTANFKKFANARKFNCYAGMAPFKHDSGTSIRGRARVSHLANKEAKRLFTLAAYSAINHNEELRQYYQRRLAEGKRKMSCINIIRAKLVARIFSIVKRQTPYVQQLAA
ncbi:IS110 family transposase [Terrimonas sp. NA20]|uniref:IS110 family transposase n=1 Tax=Terrimonas ginsenosidimutans TaxID=2908004 RepID=A0ABS9L0S5_9BACT|nr:IS110 family transposase [Terrimonas ginsenosidimutans]MCG2618224.1 IS110 family transposase [Terrimonas ginsenosidimutans]